MHRCRECVKKRHSKLCVTCADFIHPGPMYRVPAVPVEVTLCAGDGAVYPARIVALNTMELGLETTAPVPGEYTLKAHGALSLEVAGVVGRGKDHHKAFDIIAVYREETSGARLSSEEYQLLAGDAGQLVGEISQYLPRHLQEAVREKLLAELEKSEILNALRVGSVLKYEAGRFRHLSGQEDMELPLEEAEKLMRQATRQGAHRRETVISDDGSRIFDLHAMPFDFRSGGLLALDVTDIIARERQIHRQELQAYREAIAAVTGDRLQIIDREEIYLLLTRGEVLGGGEVREAADLPRARRIVQSLLAGGESEAGLHAVAVCFSEALTNTIKHAGGGSWQLLAAGEGCRLVVRDKGPGIKLSQLARATLMQHYSTKNSLGCGFTLMLYYADRLFISTGAGGTDLVLEFGRVVARSRAVSHAG